MNNPIAPRAIAAGSSQALSQGALSIAAHPGNVKQRTSPAPSRVSPATRPSYRPTLPVHRPRDERPARRLPRQRSSLLPRAFPGTLHALASRRVSFVAQPHAGGMRPTPPHSAFATVGHRFTTEPTPPPLAAFSLLAPDTARLRAFHPVRHTRRLVGMLRDAVARTAHAAGWPAEKIASFVLGHAELPGQPHRPVQAPRLAYLPLPSLQLHPDTGKPSLAAARRVLLTPLHAACHRDITWLRRALSGCQLINPHSGRPEAILSLLPRSDRVLRTYAPPLPAPAWATVTPLILPGHDDRNPAKTQALIRKAILQAGFSPALARHAQVEWSLAGYWPGADLAIRYAVPDYLRSYPRYHVRILWQDAHGHPLPLHGPICLGGGRFVGLGLFAACLP